MEEKKRSSRRPAQFTFPHLDFLSPVQPTVSGPTPSPVGTGMGPSGLSPLRRNGMTRMLPIRLLSPSPRNCFRPIAEEVYNELKSSIQVNGLVYPIIVRPKANIQSYVINGEFEILSGHNRVRACQELGMEEIRAQVVMVDDLEAVRIIADSNLQRGEVTELERAWAYRQIFEAMNRQGHRSDLDDEDESGEESENELPATVAGSSLRKKETCEIIAEMYGLSARTVRTKIRLTYLCDELYRLYEQRQLSQRAAADLSYLDMADQETLLALQKEHRFDWDQDRCEALRKDYNGWKRCGGEQEYAPQRMLRFMQPAPLEDAAPKQPKAKKPKKYEVDEALFPAGVKKSERGEYVVKALRYVLENGVEL